MSFVAPAAAIGGAALNLFGGLEGAAGTRAAGQANYNAGMYSAIVAAQNSQIANEESDRALAAGQEKAQMESLKTAGNVGAIKASQGASGVDVNSGSALKVQESARQLGQLSALNVENNAQNTAYGYRVQASQDVAQAQLDVMGGQNAQKGADIAANAQDINAFGTGLLGAAQAFGPKWNYGAALNGVTGGS